MKYIFAVVVVLVAGIILALLLAVADKFFRVEEDPRKKDIEALLPGVNCGSGGYPGCSGLAKAMVDGNSTKAKDCKVIKADKAEELQAYLDNMNK